MSLNSNGLEDFRMSPQLLPTFDGVLHGVNVTGTRSMNLYNLCASKERVHYLAGGPAALHAEGSIRDAGQYARKLFVRSSCTMSCEEWRLSRRPHCSRVRALRQGSRRPWWDLRAAAVTVCRSAQRVIRSNALRSHICTAGGVARGEGCTKQARKQAQRGRGARNIPGRDIL